MHRQSGVGPEALAATGGGSAIDAAMLRIAALDWQQPPGAELELEGVAQSWGSYDGLPPKIELLDDGRGARLLAALSYTRPDGSQWPVPVGAWLDGASIPRPFWSMIGGPFEGPYRNASIVHDHYCITHSRPWREVHRMFYEAMRCSGTGAVKARIMYYAVYRFGPRWPDALELVAEAPAGELTEANAASLAADAEAIQVHGLDLDEIEALADARNLSESMASLEGTEGAGSAQRARLLVVPGGSGTQADFEAVAREAALLPDFVLDRFERKKVRIIACRGSVTDFERDLRGVTPRGWEGTGRTWDSVPGTYFSDRKRVVIATIAQGDARVVPTKASGLHGSESLIVHESLHGYDYIRSHKPLADPRFIQARQGDFSRLDLYEQQAGRAGLEETFAESGARYFAAPDGLAAALPSLFGYWQQGPESGQEAVAATGEEAAAGEERAIGTAELLADGIRLDLRAEGPGGAIGHAMMTVRPDEPAYRGLRERLGGGAGLESAASGSMLFRAAEAAPEVPPESPPGAGQGRAWMKQNPQSFIEQVEIAPLEVPAEEGPGETPLNLDKLPTGVVSGTTLIDFSAVPDLEVRAGVSLSMLFASRVATKATRPEAGDDEDDWLAHYTSSLGQLGFTVAGTAQVHSRFKKTGVSVHKAIIPFLTIAFGGAAVGPVILAALKNLQDIDAGDPWIKLFDSQTRRFSTRELHFAAVSSTATDTAIRYAVARLNVALNETSVLFFKLTKAAADFESTTTTMSVNNSLLAVTEPTLRARLGDLTTSFIKDAEI